jgi:divalent metal cation (Fe/Co/Zn/Cd) transporter
VEARVSSLLHPGDVVVHVDPVRRSGESLPQVVSVLAAQLGLRAHNIHAHEVRGHYFVDLHAEVPPDLTLAQAHERISLLEASVRNEMQYVSDVNTHIEPWVVPVVPAQPGEQADSHLRDEILAAVESVDGLCGCHEIHVRSGPGGHDIVLHCLADPELPIAEAHRLADQAEKRLHGEIEGISQLLIHLEPEGQE